MVMGSWFAEAWAAEQEEEEEILQGPVAPPPPSPTGGFLGNAFGAPTYGPPVPTYQESAQAVFQQNPDLWQIAQGEFAQNNGAANIAAYQEMARQQEAVNRAASELGGGLNLGLPSAGDIAGFAGNLPIFGTAGFALEPFGIETPKTGVDAYNTDIPVYSDFARETLRPFLGDIGTATGAFIDPLGVGSTVLDAFGGPSVPEAGRFAAETWTPVTFGDVVANAAFAGGPVEMVTGLPFDDAIRGALSRQIDNLIPSPQALTPNSLGGREAAAVQLRGGLPAGAADVWDESVLGPLPSGPDLGQGPAMLGGEGAPIQGRVDLGGPRLVEPDDPYDTGALFGYNPAQPDYTLFPPRAVPEPPVTPPAGEPAFGPGSRGGMPGDTAFDDAVRRAQEVPLEEQLRQSLAGGGAQSNIDIAGALRGGLGATDAFIRDTWQRIAEGKGVLFGDRPGTLENRIQQALDAGQIKGPDDVARIVRAQRQAGGGVTDQPISASAARGDVGPSPSTPPPASLMPEEIADAMWDAERKAGFDVAPTPPSTAIPAGQRIDDLIREATAPPNAAPFPMTVDEAVAEAERLNINIDKGALERGTPLARQMEYDRIRAALDLDNAVRQASTETRAADAIMQQNRELRAAEGGAGGGTVPPGRAGAGGTPPNPNLLSRVYDTIVDLLYGPFGFDQSQWFRQLDVRTLNPLRAAETAQTFKTSAEAIRSGDAAQRILASHQDRIAATGVKMDLADWKGDFLSRETMTSKTLNKAIPGYEAMNRGFVTAINERRVLALEDFIKNHPKAKPAEVQSYANYLERVTGRGHFGNIDKAASRLGPLFTSLRFTASWPQRAANLLPFHRLSDGTWQIGGSLWGEAVKDHAGFIATGLTTMYLAQQAGLNVDWDKGEIIVGKQHIDIWGGGKQYVRAVLDVINGEKNGKPYPRFLERTDDGTYKGTVAEFLRNKSGPLVGAGAAILKDTGAAKQLGIEKEVKFLRPDYWDRGVTGKALGWGDRVAQYVVPLWVQDVAKAVMAESPDNRITIEGIKAGALAGAGSFTGASVQSYETNRLSQMRNDTLAPTGQRYADLLPKEQQSLNKALEAKYGEEYTKAFQEQQARLDPAIRNYQTQRDQVYQQTNSEIDRIVKGLQEGAYDPRAARVAIKALDSEASGKVQELRNDPAYRKAVSEFPDQDSTAQRALTAYYAIPSLYRDANGKVDWDAVEGKRAEMLNSLPITLRQRLEQEVNTPDDRDHPYLKMLKNEAATVERYKSLPDAEEARLRRENPLDDAKLVYMGYSPYVLTPKAAEYLRVLAPGQPANVGRR